MTDEQAKELFKKILRIAMKDVDKKEKITDLEDWHISADELLIKVLRCEGYDELCDWFEKHDKWYA